MNSEQALSHLKRDATLKPLIDSIDIPDFTPSGNVYFALLDSIVSQQLSTKAAATIFNRFCALFPENYPHSDLLANMTKEQLRSVGLSVQKSTYLQNVADFSQQYDLENHRWNEMSDDEIVTFLTQIKGVGIWSAQMVMMFTIGRYDVFPIGDLGIQQAMIGLFGMDKNDKKLKTKMLECAEPWRPYRTIASRYLWRWKDGAMKAKTEG